MIIHLSRAEVFDAFSRYIQPWRGRYLPIETFVDVRDDVAIPLPDLCAGIERLGIAELPLPVDAVRKLELFEGATYAHAIALLTWVYAEQPIEITPEEEAEQEASMLMFSEFAEIANANRPKGIEPLPVIYPRDQRTKH